MQKQSASQITELLDAWRNGDESAKQQLMEAVYTELRRMAGYFLRGERAGHTLQATAIVNELYIRLLGERAAACRDREHFFALAAVTMRRILVDHARAAHARRRGGSWARVSLTLAGFAKEVSLDDLLDLDVALERLKAADARAAQVVEMRFFAGMEEKEIAAVLGLAEVTVKRDWRFARAWLFAEINGAPIQ